MEKLVFKRITAENEIDLFLDRFENYVGVRLPFNYAKNSTIVGVFLHDKLVGGYMIVTKPGFRSLMFVPDSIKKSDKFFQQDQYEMMEINGLWISQTIKSTKQQFSVWMRIMKDIFLAKKRFIILMGDARNKNIEHIHSLTSPTKIYEGTPSLMVGFESHSKIRVSYTTRWNILKGIHKYWREYKSRESREKSKTNQGSAPQHLKQPGAKYT